MSLIAGHPDFDNVTRLWDVLARAKDACRQNFLHTLWEDFEGDPAGYGNSSRWNPSAGLVDTGSVIAGDEAGGSVIFSTGANASSVSGLAPANAIGATPWTVATAAAGKAFYLEARAKITTTPGANSILFVGFTDGTNTLGLGIFGALSTTLWKAQHSANLATTAANLGRSNDTAYHRLAMWSNGRDGNVYVQIDGDAVDAPAVVTVTPTVTYSKLRLLVTARNGATAADQRLQVSRLFVAVEP
jgi:hypothetical protein